MSAGSMSVVAQIQEEARSGSPSPLMLSSPKGSPAGEAAVRSETRHREGNPDLHAPYLQHDLPEQHFNTKDDTLVTAANLEELMKKDPTRVKTLSPFALEALRYYEQLPPFEPTYYVCGNVLCRRKWKHLTQTMIPVFCPSCKRYAEWTATVRFEDALKEAQRDMFELRITPDKHRS